MANWINRHVGEVCLGGFGVLGAAAIGFAYNVGQNSSALTAVSDGLSKNAAQVSANGEKLDALRIEMAEQFDRLSARVDLDQTDLKTMLVATGVVKEGDVFYASVISGDVWVFPSDAVEKRFQATGATPENATNYLTGYKIMELPLK